MKINSYKKEIRKIIIIQSWWKTIYKIINIQKNIRKFLLKIKYVNERKKEKLNNIKYKYLIKWLDITYKRIILKKLKIFNCKRKIKKRNTYIKKEEKKIKKKKKYKEKKNIIQNNFLINNSLDKKKINYFLYSRNTNINPFKNQKLSTNVSKSHYSEIYNNLINNSNYINTSNSKNNSNSINSDFKSTKIKKSFIENREKVAKNIFGTYVPTSQNIPFAPKNSYKKITLRKKNKNFNLKKNIKSPKKENINNSKNNNAVNLKEMFNYKKKLNNSIIIRKYYFYWKTQVKKKNILKILINYILLKKSIIHFHFMIYGKLILKKLISYKKRKMIKELFIYLKKRILINIFHSISVLAKLKKLFYNLKNKIFIIELKKILFSINDIFYINDIDFFCNKNIKFIKDGKIINNININNYYNNNFINLNDIKYNKNLDNLNKIKIPLDTNIIKINKSCEKRNINNNYNNILVYIKKNTSAEKRFKQNNIKNIQSELNIMSRNKDNIIPGIHTFYHGNNNNIFNDEDTLISKFKVIFKIYSKFFEKNQKYICMKKWKENIISNNSITKIINKKIKLNENFLKFAKTNNTTQQNENTNFNTHRTINNKNLKNNVYYRKKLNLDKTHYQMKNIMIKIPINNSFNYNENDTIHFLTERQYSKMKLMNDTNIIAKGYIPLKNNVIEEKEIHFNKKIK